jgi:hypothetical protein
MDTTTALALFTLALVSATTAGIWLLLRRHRAQRPYSTVRDPSVTMIETWRAWMEQALDATQDRLRAEACGALDRRQLDAVREDLLEFEREVLSKPYPLTTLRKEMMASVDRRLLNIEILRLPPYEKRELRHRQPDLIQSDGHAREYIIANEVRLAILRRYAALRYGDQAENDWFSVYERAARLKQKTARSMILRGLHSDENEPQDARQQAIEMVDSQLRMRLLQVPPGTSFRRDPRLGGPDEADDDSGAKPGEEARG